MTNKKQEDVMEALKRLGEKMTRPSWAEKEEVKEEIKVSNCVICKEELRQEQQFVQIGEPVYGPGNRGYWKTDIWCERCGITYRHAPIEEAQTT